MASRHHGRSEKLSYADGAIVRISLTNFMTYDSVEFTPGPHLNVVVAPNGTGKSTLVNSICLGLAGKTSWLGRASKPTEFIKHGTNKATIVIELKNKDGDNYIIKREIFKTSQNESKKEVWSVNDRVATIKSVEECVAKLNIQVGNLCQFLPQDRVADFAKMSQIELLENTEKAVGESGLLENHYKLKNYRKNHCDSETRLNNLRERLKQEKERNTRLEADVKSFEHRERYLDKIATLKKKRPWVEYEDNRQKYIEAKTKCQELNAILKKASAQNAPLRAKLFEAEKRVQKIDAEMKKKTDSLKQEAQKAADKNKAIEELTDKAEEVQSDLKCQKNDEIKRQKKLHEVLKVISALENDMANLDNQEDVQPQLDRVSQDIRNVNSQQQRVTQSIQQVDFDLQNLQRDITNTQRQLRAVLDVGNQRLGMLRNKHRDTYQAVLWLRENSHLFKATIHEPLMLVINVNDRGFAKYVEQHISFNDMKAFVCDDPDDTRTFLKRMRDEQGLRVNAMRVPDQSLNSFKPHQSLDTLRPYGFHYYLKDLFTCPESVLRYLCAQYHVHNIPVGDKYTKDNVESVLNELPSVRNFYAENTKFNITQSKYGSREKYTSRSALRDPSLLTASVDAEAKNQLTAQLNQLNQSFQNKNTHLEQLRATAADLEKQMNVLRMEKRELMKKKDLKKNLAGQINVKREQVRRLENEAKDIESKEKAAQRKIQDFDRKKCQYLHDLKEHTKKCLAYSQEKVRLSLQHASAKRLVTDLNEELKEQDVALQNLKLEFEEIQRHQKETKEKARMLLQEAKRVCGIKDSEELSADLRKAFDTCPGTLEGIDADIHQYQAKADCTDYIDPQVIKDYKERKVQIQQMESNVAKLERSVGQQQTELDELKKNWLEPLNKLVEKINTNFGKFFSAINCAGTVSLAVPPNPEDFSDYGLLIKCMFRDNEVLRPLSPQTQSGGERSVATVLFMMSLQELTKCPFRCVDEINQGMDAFNERRVFELVVQTACREDTSQYFLLTPKLLPDLEYRRNMTVLCIYNGPHMLDHTEWNVKKFLKRRKRCQEDED